MKNIKVLLSCFKGKGTFPFVYLFAAPPLLLPSLRLFIPPLRLVSAAMWHIVQKGNVHDYGMVEDFISTITEIVPELLNADQKAQLLLGLRARVSKPVDHPPRIFLLGCALERPCFCRWFLNCVDLSRLQTQSPSSCILLGSSP